MPPEDLDSSEEEEEFIWEDYLEKTKSEAAPSSCFCQQLIPPSNEFKVGNKLETIDPRCTTSVCIATVKENSGPRIRLRLEGTDDRNDFWLLVDSDLIHPFGFTAKQGRKIQPPLGFGNDLSKWPKFLEKIVNMSGEDVFASEACFKPSPIKPSKNEFKVGQKLEAVDPKNPQLICPATIKEIKRDKLLVTFDGWSQSSQFWCSYTSRDLFPAGWCKAAGHVLQMPGTLPERKNNTTINTSPIANNLNSTIKRAKTKKPTAKSKPPVNNKKPNESHESSDTSINIPNETITLNQTPQANKSQDLKLSTTLEKSIANNQDNINNNNNNENCNEVDLSIVKDEAFDPIEFSTTIAPTDKVETNSHLNNISLNTNGDLNNLNNSALVLNTANKNKCALNAIVYVIPNGDCGKLIKTAKFHQSHTRFGPGAPSSVYKSIIQSFVDSAVDRYEVFKLIPAGNSNECVRLKNVNFNERKQLIPIGSVCEMWSSIKSFCSLLEIDDAQLFSKQRVILPANNTNNNENNSNLNEKKTEDLKEKPCKTLARISETTSRTQPEQQPQQLNGNVALLPNPQTPTSSSLSSSTTTTTATASSDAISTTTTEASETNLKSIGQKRRSTAASSSLSHHNHRNRLNSDNLDETINENDIDTPHSAPKIYKLDNSLTSTPISDWTVDQVVYYIYQLNDSYFSSYVDMFRHQEIDGKALLLLTTDILMKYMGFKLGPALKLNNYIDKLRKNTISNLSNNYNQVTPKTECNY